MPDKGITVDLMRLPQQALEDTTEEGRRSIADRIAEIASWDGLAASLATKVLHKKSADLVPIFDNLAIFGAYMNSGWPDERALENSEYGAHRIKEALDSIAFDLVRPENHAIWPELKAIEPARSPIQLFDSVWWMEFRRVEPR